jgi:hypothetical protein
MQRIVWLTGLTVGILLGYIDSRPGWDDTGVTAVAVLATSLVLGALSPQRPWATALLVGAWIPLFGILTRANYGSLLALALAFAGAYAGVFLRRAIVPA